MYGCIYMNKTNTHMHMHTQQIWIAPPSCALEWVLIKNPARFVKGRKLADCADWSHQMVSFLTVCKHTHLNHMVVSHMPEESLLQEVSSTFFSSVGFLQGGGGGAVILCSVLCKICCQSSLSSHSFLLQSRSSCRATLSFSESLSWWITCEKEIRIIKKVDKVNSPGSVKLQRLCWMRLHTGSSAL